MNGYRWQGTHRISGDTVGSWFLNRRFRYRQVGEAAVERLKIILQANEGAKAPAFYIIAFDPSIVVGRSYQMYRASIEHSRSAGELA